MKERGLPFHFPKSNESQLPDGVLLAPAHKYPSFRSWDTAPALTEIGDLAIPREITLPRTGLPLRISNNRR